MLIWDPRLAFALHLRCKVFQLNLINSLLFSLLFFVVAQGRRMKTIDFAGYSLTHSLVRMPLWYPQPF